MRFKLVECIAALQIWTLAGLGLALCGVLHADGPKTKNDAAPLVDYHESIQPIFSRYCIGCHNDREPEGELSLESFAALQKGGTEGTILAASAAESRLIRVLAGSLEPSMPPEGEERPTAEEIALLSRWIDAGAAGPKEGIKRTTPIPQLTPAAGERPITALAISPNGKRLAVARYNTIELFELFPGEDLTSKKPLQRLEGHAGKINDLRFTPHSDKLLAAGGTSGRSGEIVLWDIATGERLKTYNGHKDTVYVAVLDGDEKILASGSYDHKIILWNFESGKVQHTLSGHNGPVFDLAFSPDANNLVSASGDTTVKVWHVPSGRRVDTRSEPLKEQYSVAFSPDGTQFAAAGADNRIRVWKLESREKLKINPMLQARFGHEGAITRLRYAADGHSLVSVALDQAIKVWEMPQLKQRTVYERQSDTVEALAVDPVGGRLVVGRMDGSLGFYPLRDAVVSNELASTPGVGFDTEKNNPHNIAPVDSILASGQIQEVRELEPNDLLTEAHWLHPPSVARGTIQRTDARKGLDSDLYRFNAQAGESWVFEIDAARSDSPLDSKIEILDREGQPVTQVFLQAVRDSYFTYRGKNSNQIDDFRLHNWREMQLNQYLYANGEVVRLYHYPRGPDSGFKVYPNFGGRHGYYGTTPLSHAMGEVCYIVESHASEESIVPNGLPVFPIPYENDDDSLRELGRDSRLTFIAPETGEYLVRVRDVRGFSGPEYTYRLHLRPSGPNFKLRFDRNITVPPGGGRRVNMKLKRIDGFAGPVNIEISNLPKGFSIPGPLSIEAGQHRATAVLMAAANAAPPSEADAKKVKVTAKSVVNGKEILHDLGDLGTLKLDRTSKLDIVIVPENEPLESEGLPVLTISAGQTIKCRLQVDRKDHQGVIGFGHEEAAWNLPHGMYVDNIGLNGVLMLATENEREVFITCEPWVKSQQRPIFFEAGIDGRPASSSVMLQVVPSKTSPPLAVTNSQESS